ncbi:hypothetical protein PO587_02755 [Streptomyces gilvifuscus]|uniref:Uncharacterized protein n=1 Tax=Streptomyces gilvifuscus TaxID=1550617 RepID=A0ABT5FLH0_9ACTN|nr:hypothetical protein [Streptomyces gilvifuscus]MDC2953371.1 hypothetical protein [Streptomyces gilvifuscus]
MSMAFGPKISTAPGTRPDSRHETVYDSQRGGHYPKNEPVRDSRKDGKK